jgi:hypothetical protein
VAALTLSRQWPAGHEVNQREQKEAEQEEQTQGLDETSGEVGGHFLFWCYEAGRTYRSVQSATFQVTTSLTVDRRP